ncbi:MAG: hypothetical protein KDD47_02350 [Acidobacteria bacterium]|nr:hypothetical protein [Acidobacteriota bacterium]
MPSDLEPIRVSSATLRLAWALSLLLLPALAPGASAQTVVQNDSITDFGEVAIQVGFVANEMAGAWLTSPCDGQITHVRVIWLSFTGGAADTLGEWVRVFDEGTFPVPGAVLADLPGPVLQDGFENEFTLPMPITVISGQNFVVGFKFLTTPPTLGPSLVTDTDGCQAGRNGIFAIPPNAWFNACSLGVSGDFGLRAVVSCGTFPFFQDGFETGDTSAWSATDP